MSFAVTAKLICVFVFAYAKTWFSHNEAHLKVSKNRKIYFNQIIWLDRWLEFWQGSTILMILLMLLLANLMIVSLLGQTILIKALFRLK